MTKATRIHREDVDIDKNYEDDNRRQWSDEDCLALFRIQIAMLHQLLIVLVGQFLVVTDVLVVIVIIVLVIRDLLVVWVVRVVSSRPSCAEGAPC